MAIDFKAMMMGRRFRNISVTAVLLAATVLGIACQGPAGADGTLILGATPVFDPYLNESENLTFTAYVVSNQSAIIQWFVDGIRQNSSVTNFVYRPDYRAAGDHNLTAVVNTTDMTDMHTWTVHVINRDEPLYITGWEPAGDVAIKSGSSQKFSIAYLNPDGDPLTLQWSVNGGLALGENRSDYTFMAGSTLSGLQVVTAYISDGTTTRTLSWNVTVDMPVQVAPTGAVRLLESESQTFQVMNKAGMTFNWYLDGAALTESGPRYVYRPGFDAARTEPHRISVSVSDGSLYAWNALVINNNQPPVLSEGRLMDVQVGESIALKATAYDLDGNITRYQWDINSDGIVDYESLTSPNTTWTFTSAGEYKAILRVIDNDNLASSTIYVFQAKEKKTTFNWWIPAVFVAVLVLLMLFIVAVQARRISRMKEERSKEAFFARTAAKRVMPEDDEPKFRESAPLSPEPAPEMPKEEPQPPPEVPKPEEEPEVLQVKPSLGDKGMDSEVKHAGPDTEIKLSPKKPEKEEPTVKKGDKKKSELDDIITTLLDKGAESDAGASETEIHEAPSKQKKEKGKKEEPKPAEPVTGLKDKKAEGEVSSEDPKDVPEMKKKKKN